MICERFVDSSSAYQGYGLGLVGRDPHCESLGNRED